MKTAYGKALLKSASLLLPSMQEDLDELVRLIKSAHGVDPEELKFKAASLKVSAEQIERLFINF